MKFIIRELLVLGKFKPLFKKRESFIFVYYLKWNTRAVYDEEMQAISYAYTAWMHPRAKESTLVYFGSSERCDSYCCNRDSFCGNYRDERNPVEVEDGKLSNTNLNGGEPCGALHSHMTIAAGAEKNAHYYLCVTEGALSDYENVVQQTKETLTALRKPATSESRMWLYASGEYSKNYIRIFEYQPDRSGKRPESFLKGFTGCLVTDGYAGYNQVKRVIHCGCWTHARRKWREAMPDGYGKNQ